MHAMLASVGFTPDTALWRLYVKIRHGLTNPKWHHVLAGAAFLAIAYAHGDAVIAHVQLEATQPGQPCSRPTLGSGPRFPGLSPSGSLPHQFAGQLSGHRCLPAVSVSGFERRHLRCLREAQDFGDRKAGTDHQSCPGIQRFVGSLDAFETASDLGLSKHVWNLT